jgi:hypothetical protein
MFSVRVLRLVQCCKSRLNPNACKIKQLRVLYGIPVPEVVTYRYGIRVWYLLYSQAQNIEDTVNYQIAMFLGRNAGSGVIPNLQTRSG